MKLTAFNTWDPPYMPLTSEDPVGSWSIWWRQYTPVAGGFGHWDLVKRLRVRWFGR